MMNPPTISYLTDIYFEPGIVSQLQNLLNKHGISRPLIVTDQALASMGMVERLGLSEPLVFDQVQNNPTEADVLAGLNVWRQNKCDGLVALGGGSPMDCAKAIAVLARHEPPLAQYAFIHGGVTRITADQPPLIAIPTTAGTGSEVGRGALITVQSGDKLALISPHLIPNAALCDPLLTLKLPAWLTAATGMDAISHCVETFCSPKFNPVTEAIALDGLVRACRFIRSAVDDGSNQEARSEMMMAALQGGLTFQKGLGFIHSLSHPLGSLTEKRLHHGTLNTVFLPHVLRFNMDACPEKMSQITQALASVLNIQKPADLPDAFAQLSMDIGLPASLSQMGVEPEDLAGMPEAAMRDHGNATNPRKVTLEDCRAAYEAAS
jgi:4-hydroxybutyrate dehydrogenase